MSTEVNLRLVIKLLMMTTSANDQEATTAMRKANDAVSRAGWDWERLLLGKVTVVEDPFSRISEPTVRNGSGRTAPSAPSRPAPEPEPAPQTAQGWGTAAPPRPASQPRMYTCDWCNQLYPAGSGYSGQGSFCSSTCHNRHRLAQAKKSNPSLDPLNNINAHSTQLNQFSGSCWQCGTFVNSSDGWIIRKPPGAPRSSGGGRYATLCGPCNAAGRPLSATPARKQRPSTANLMGGLT